MTCKYIEIDTQNDEILRKFKSNVCCRGAEYILLNDADWATVPDQHLLFAGNGKALYKWQNGQLVSLDIDIVYPISDLQADKKTEIKNNAKAALGDDWQVMRHLEEDLVGDEHVLSQSELDAIISARNTIRDESDTKEADIYALTDREDIENYDTSF